MAVTTDPIFPFGPASVETLTYAATIASTVNNSMTILTVALTGAATLNLTLDANLRVGSILIVRASSDGTARDLTPGTGMTGTVVAGVINKTKCATYVYNGTAFVHIATQQID